MKKENPTERPSNDGRPHRIVASGMTEMPFGKGKKFLSSVGRPLEMLVAGSLGPPTNGSRAACWVTGDRTCSHATVRTVEYLLNVNRTYDTWFNTADFERNSAKGPTSFARRTFVTRVPGPRADSTNQWNANAVKNIHLTERMNMQLRMDALNVQNRSQMNGPLIDPYSTNFGKRRPPNRRPRTVGFRYRRGSRSSPDSGAFFPNCSYGGRRCQPSGRFRVSGGMKTFLLLVTIAAGIAGAHSIPERQQNQKLRIAQGVRSGELTRAEAARLASEQRAIARQVRRDRVDGGGFTAKERRVTSGC